MKKINLIVILVTFIHSVTFSQRESVYTDIITSKKAAKNIYHLDLSQHYKDFGYQLPEAIRNYKNLETIRFGNKYLIRIPPWIEKLKSLKSISFNNRFLECSSQERLKELGVVNPNQNDDYNCYEKVPGIASDWGTPVLAGVSINDTLCVISVETGDIIFKDFDDLKITPCGDPIVVRGRAILFPPLTYDNLTSDDFYQYHFPSSIKKIYLEHCEGGIHEIELNNGEAYYFNNRQPIIVKKGKKKIDYSGEKTDCEQIIDQIDDKWYELKTILEEYYFYSGCTPELIDKASKQAETINRFGKYYRWDFSGQDIVPKRIKAYPVEMNDGKQKECMQIIENWQETNPGTEEMPVELMLTLENKGCLRIELAE